MKKTTPDDWSRASQLKAEGKTNKEIGDAIGVTPGRVSQKLGKKRELYKPKDPSFPQ